jgi:hypothetical protein
MFDDNSGTVFDPDSGAAAFPNSSKLSSNSSASRISATLLEPELWACETPSDLSSNSDTLGNTYTFDDDCGTVFDLDSGTLSESPSRLSSKQDTPPYRQCQRESSSSSSHANASSLHTAASSLQPSSLQAAASSLHTEASPPHIAASSALHGDGGGGQIGTELSGVGQIGVELHTEGCEGVGNASLAWSAR